MPAGRMKLLCPVDFSGASRAALRHAANIADKSRGTVEVLFVNDPLLTAAAAAAYDARGLARSAETALKAFVRRTLPGGTPSRAGAVTCTTALGRPAREIVKAARLGRADLIVMGSHGLGGVQKLLLGSVTEEVLKTAAVPVLVVPPGARSTPRRTRR
jgi:nucleotide-binding universal stress UspA family protein